MAHYRTKVVAFVFSSVTRQWCIAASPSWSSLGTDRPHGLQNCSDSRGCRGMSSFDHVRGCFYSASPWMDKFLVLDTRRMEFSTISDHSGFHELLRRLPGQPLAEHAAGFLFLGGTTESQQDCHETEWVDTWDIDYFSVEVRTSELKKICTMTKPCFNHERVHPYFGFPPSLSRPTI
ncbi:unnamed protein product [Triticum turgidum subsp. durum]|uniref:Uncharacterized protein n=1 Tax=Triticum turgidum subsp. durum TaxID=4567 RepID=A0A9R0XV90_TRITD|nr:unnamed protein product [Triticum turgidum subsp. durum]